MEETTFWFRIAKHKHKGQRASEWSCLHSSCFLAQVGGCLRAGAAEPGLSSPQNCLTTITISPMLCLVGGRHQAAVELFHSCLQGDQVWFTSDKFYRWQVSDQQWSTTTALQAQRPWGLQKDVVLAMGSKPLASGRAPGKGAVQGKWVWKHRAKGTPLHRGENCFQWLHWGSISNNQH